MCVYMYVCESPLINLRCLELDFDERIQSSEQAFRTADILRWVVLVHFFYKLMKSYIAGNVCAVMFGNMSTSDHFHM